MLRNVRRTSQGLILLIFLWLFLQTESKGANDLAYPVKIFLDIDPLLWLTTALATRSPERLMSFSLIVIIVTALLGRVFCGWVCPLGTLNDLAGRLSHTHRRPIGWFRLKYLILFFILAASVFTLHPAGFIDPLSLMIRSLALSLYPAFIHAVNTVFDTIYAAHIPVVTDVSEVIYGFLKVTVLPFRPPQFHQALFLGVFFLGIIGLNLIERRFWCRYLCPLGALLGLLSRRALLKQSISEGCSDCGVCTAVCRAGSGPAGAGGWKVSECVACMDCDDLCPRAVVRINFSGKKQGAPDLGRRRIAAALAAGIASVSFIRVTPFSRSGTADPTWIRPPGSLSEADFLQRCVKCGECMKVCLTGGLQPALFEGGVEGLWTPILVPRIGYCEYRCTLCGQVCPTGAIKKLNLEEKAKVRIGLAMIDPGRCLPYAQGIPCIVCQEVCPTPKKAIWLEETTARAQGGKEIAVKKPHVDPTLCIGCGICETQCPVLGCPAVTIASLGESRSNENQLLLP